MSKSASARVLLGRGSWSETARIAVILRRETVGGALLLAATALALVWANSPLSDSYASLKDFQVGPARLHLDLTLEQWAADGLLAIFFFVVGLELKREFVAGDLRDPARAVLPIAAAIGGMVLPALAYVAVTLDTGGGALRGWAIPTATDIAFALAVLAVHRYPPAGGAAIRFCSPWRWSTTCSQSPIIAVFYTSDLHPLPLLGAAVPLALFTAAVQRRIRSWWLLLPLAAAVWVLVHTSGVHATVAGVLLGFAVPVVPSQAAGGPDAGPGLAEHFEHRFRPISAGIAVPVFAFFATGVTVGGLSGLVDALVEPVALGVVVGLVVGKTIGIFGTAYLLARLTRARLDSDLRWVDVLGVSLLAGVGFTVSLLIGDLAFGIGSARDGHVKVGVLAGSVVASTLAAIVLGLRNRAYRRIERTETIDADNDGVPDVFDQPD